MELKRVKGVATGKVQGVGFRYFVSQHANELNVVGWIRNMEDGSVHMELQGTEKNVEALLELIRKGNFIINVKHLELTDIPVVDDEAFIIRS